MHDAAASEKNRSDKSYSHIQTHVKQQKSLKISMFAFLITYPFGPQALQQDELLNLMHFPSLLFRCFCIFAFGPN